MNTTSGTSTMLCAHCRRPCAVAVWLGDLPYHPECTRGPGYQSTYAPLPPAAADGCRPWTGFDEAAVRRIVREELAHAESEKARRTAGGI
jgi:hypothetical protein